MTYDNSARKSGRTTAIDFTTLATLRENTGDMFAEILRIFLIDSPKRVSAVRLAADRNDVDAVRHEAHQLKGSSGNIGARNLYLICDALERQCTSENWHSATSLVDLLCTQHEKAAGLLSEVLRDMEAKP